MDQLVALEAGIRRALGPDIGDTPHAVRDAQPRAA
jgi:hypothetical protein